MQRSHLGLLLLATVTLASCGQQTGMPQSNSPTSDVRTQILDIARNPGLQEPDIQRILLDNADDSQLLARLNGQMSDESQVQLQAQALSGKALYTFGVATGTVAHYWQERASPNYSGLNWTYDGCSVPQWILDRSETARTYKAKFAQPCNVHDFGYRNASVITSNWAVGQGYRLLVDQAFGRNMDRVCAGISGFIERTKCYAVSYAFEKAVILGGFNKLNL